MAASRDRPYLLHEVRAKWLGQSSIGRSEDGLRRFRSFIRLVASIGNEFFARNGPYMAAAVSFYALFSMFPLMLALIAVAGFFLESESFRDRLIEGIP